MDTVITLSMMSAGALAVSIAAFVVAVMANRKDK